MPGHAPPGPVGTCSRVPAAATRRSVASSTSTAVPPQSPCTTATVGRSSRSSLRSTRSHLLTNATSGGASWSAPGSPVPWRTGTTPAGASSTWSMNTSSAATTPAETGRLPSMW
jgi:hypothetical protein